jgi:hypothetical protein
MGTGDNALGATNVPRTVEIVGNQMVVLDEDGNGCGCHRLPEKAAPSVESRPFRYAWGPPRFAGVA